MRRPASRYRLIRATHLDADLGRANVPRVERWRHECWHLCRLHRHFARRDQHPSVPFDLFHPPAEEICVQLVVQGDGRERHSRALTSRNNLGFKRQIVVALTVGGWRYQGAKRQLRVCRQVTQIASAGNAMTTGKLA
jgi:hypothetical protein